ncbi:unnamed protein product [Linum trigynum]|uniref:Uncharacterized protein n=1 Tax=Linum trigynum TaxID=586398 RepID=A0AAV2DV72_9ROSI
MAGTGESPETATGRKNLPAAMTTDQKWRGENLYLKYKYGSWIFGIKAFEDIDKLARKVVNGCEVLVPTVVCERNFLDADPGFPIGNGFFKLNGKAYLVGGETAEGKPWGAEVCGLPYQLLESSKKSSGNFYEFSPDTNTLHLLDKLSLPLPMPSPIVVEIKGKVYVLYGDHCCQRRHGFPKDSENCFQVLALDDDGKPHWKPLPAPPFYEYATRSHYFKDMVAVVGYKLYVEVGIELYAFDVDTLKWELGGHWFPSGAKTLSSRLMKEGKDCCFVVLYAMTYGDDPNQDGLYAALVDCKNGDLLHRQHVPKASPSMSSSYLVTYHVVELEQDGSAGHSCSPFCFVYTTCDDLVGVSVLRFSLAAASPDEKDSKRWFQWGTDRLTLKPEILESRLYEKPKSVNDLYTGHFDAVFLKAG